MVPITLMALRTKRSTCVIYACVYVYVCREYEARIAELKEQFGLEQADKAKLQLELDRLQKEWDEQLQSLQTQVHALSFSLSLTLSISLFLSLSLSPCVSLSLSFSLLRTPTYNCTCSTSTHGAFYLYCITGAITALSSWSALIHNNCYQLGSGAATNVNWCISTTQ